ncbi:MAG: hypothetical protein PHC51_02055 [bacterium]|nr:hypothetical protein [bacterium]
MDELSCQMTGQEKLPFIPKLDTPARSLPADKNDPESLRKSISIRNACSCFYFGKRPLSGLKAVNKRPLESPMLGKANLEPLHEHGYFADNGDNIGYGPHGLFSENMQLHNYVFDPVCYDSAKAAQAITAVKPQSYLMLSPIIDWLTRPLSPKSRFDNCQSYTAKLRKFITGK